MPWVADPVIRQWRADRGDTREYGWFLCKECGNGYPSFQPSQELLSFFWNRDRQDELEQGADEQGIWNVRREAARKNAARVFKMFASEYTAAPGRFLDIACGLGETIKFFSDRGWDAQGIDVDPALKRFHDEIGIRSQIGPIETVHIDGKFDIINISHAIYFITNPEAFLKRLASNLQSDGLLCIVISNFLASEGAGLSGYAHSFFPTGGSMTYALERAGYQTVFCRVKSGSIYIAARRGEGAKPLVYPRLIHLAYQTRLLRYALIGAPKLWLHAAAKRMLSLARNR